MKVTSLVLILNIFFFSQNVSAIEFKFNILDFKKIDLLLDHNINLARNFCSASQQIHLNVTKDVVGSLISAVAVGAIIVVLAKLGAKPSATHATRDVGTFSNIISYASVAAVGYSLEETFNISDKLGEFLSDATNFVTLLEEVQEVQNIITHNENPRIEISNDYYNTLYQFFKASKNDSENAESNLENNPYLILNNIALLINTGENIFCK